MGALQANQAANDVQPVPWFRPSKHGNKPITSASQHITLYGAM
jgi:hypothetical protein